MAAAVGAEPEVNHYYEREHRFNLWFVATGPDRAAVDAVLDGIEARTRLAVLDLPLVRRSLLASIWGSRAVMAREATRRDRASLHRGAVEDGLPLAPRPFAALAPSLGLSEAEVIAAHLRRLLAAG